jgi:hypothetical protein
MKRRYQYLRDAELSVFKKRAEPEKSFNYSPSTKCESVTGSENDKNVKK